MPIRFVLLLIVVALFFCQPAGAQDTAVAPPAQEIVCTVPSTLLLSPNDSGSSAGGVNAFLIGAKIFAESSFRYIGCLGRKVYAGAVAISAKITHFKQSASDTAHKFVKPKPAPEAE